MSQSNRPSITSVVKDLGRQSHALTQRYRFLKSRYMKWRMSRFAQCVSWVEAHHGGLCNLLLSAGGSEASANASAQHPRQEKP